MSSPKDGCAKPAAGIIQPGAEPVAMITTAQAQQEVPEMLARVGYPAPDFEATAYYRGGFSNIKLSDYRGKWILVCFYPGDFTFVWPTEISAVAVNHKLLEELDCQVLSVSMDSRFVHKMWEEHELSRMIGGPEMPFPMLADIGGTIGTAYGVYDETAGVDIRGRFIIDPDFVIQGMEVLTPTVGRNFAETLRQLRAFQHVRTTGEVTPAGWQPGGKTLTPGPALVGKVWEVWQPK